MNTFDASRKTIKLGMEGRRRRAEQASGQRPRSEYKGSPFLGNYSPRLTGCVGKKRGQKNEREREKEERIDRVKIVIFIVYFYRRCAILVGQLAIVKD